MPVLSSLGAASSLGWSHTTPVVTGGTLTADDTYYYRTFTNAGQWDELSVSGGPVEMDVLIVGRGGDGGVSQNQQYGAAWNFYYHSYDSCNTTWDPNCCTGYAQCYSCYWDCYWDCYYICNRRWNYYNDDYRAYPIFSGGGGAGGVITTKIMVAPGKHLISVAAKGGVTFPDMSDSISYAFGIGAGNGGSATENGVNGAGIAFATLNAKGNANTTQQTIGPSATGEPVYKANENASWTQVTNAPMTAANSYSITSAAGFGGSGNGDTYTYGAVSGQALDMNGLISSGYLNNYSTRDAWYYGGWGGGAGKYGFGAGGMSYSGNMNDPLGTPLLAGGSESLYKMAPTKLVNGTWSRSAFGWEYNSNNITSVFGASTTTQSTYAGNIGLYDVDYGIGIQALGLKVAGGGMGNRSARFLGNAYGGGYPGDAATTNPWGYNAQQMAQYGIDEWDLTPKKNGKPNTGGGGGGGTGGSGVVRVRYLRSAVGG